MTRPKLSAVLAAYQLGGRQAVAPFGVYMPDERVLQKLVMEAVGAASMCWEHIDRAGVFDADKASRVGNQLIEELVNMLIATQLHG